MRIVFSSGSRDEMRAICWYTGYGGQNGKLPLTGSASAPYFFVAAFLVFIIGSPLLLWAQSTSRSSISRLITQNRLDDAEKQLWSVLSQQPEQVWALDLMAEIRTRQKRAPEAEALFRRVLTLSPKDVEAYRGLGKLYSSLGNNPQAIDSYLHVVAIAPADVAANVELALLYQSAGQYRESMASAQRISLSSRPPRILPVLAADYFPIGEPDKVPPLIPSLQRHAKAEPEVLRDFITVLLRNGYVEDAVHLMDNIKPVKPSADYLQTLQLVPTAHV